MDLTNLPPQPTALIFDFGGVLIDWNPRYLYRKLFPGDEPTMERFLAEIGFDDWNRLQDAGRPFAVAVPELCARHPQYCDLIRAYDERYPESLGGAIPGTVEILHRLWTAGFPLFALSNWPAEKYHQVRSNFPFFTWFHEIVISGEVGCAKPDPRIFQILLDKVNRPPEACLLIDDAPANISAARALGFQTIRFQDAPQLARELALRGLLTDPVVSPSNQV
ncbi:MAG: HAD family phosphatase [Anaerolineales bacterium]|jgi:2-haloacid dehalogenase|nr:HAD family phosphatase [Anaerolineales bacterium]